MKYIIYNQKYQQVFLIIVLFIISVFFFYQSINRSIGGDDAYYLSIILNIGDGMIPYKDFPVFYPPISFYLSYFLSYVKNPQLGFSFALFIYYAITLFNGYVLYRIIKRFNPKVDIKEILVLFFLINLYCEGLSFLLEQFVLFFTLPSVYFAIKGIEERPQYWFYSGIFSALAFLTKQYGLGALGIVGLILIYERGFLNPKLWIEILFLLLGFISVLILFLIWMFVNDISLNLWLNLIFFSGYGSFEIQVLWKFLHEHLQKWIVSGFVIFSLSLFFMNPRNKQLFFISLVGFIIFSFQFLFQPYKHYFILNIPFLIMLWFNYFSSIFPEEFNIKSINVHQWMFFSLFLILFQFFLRDVRYWIREPVREQQINVYKQKLSPYLKLNPVLIDYQAAFYILGYQQPLHHKFGNFFPNGLSKDLVKEAAFYSRYVICSAESYQNKIEFLPFLKDFEIIEKSDWGLLLLKLKHK